MGLFKKRGEILDLTEKYRKQQEQASQVRTEIKDSKEESSTEKSSNPVQTAFGFFENLTSSSNKETNSSEENSTSEIFETSIEKRKKIAKRLLDMTTKLDDISNQIYHLQQRVEVLERKSDVNRFN